jgi:NADH:ubiquinone oxidoreductase subunit
LKLGNQNRAIGKPVGPKLHFSQNIKNKKKETIKREWQHQTLQKNANMRRHITPPIKSI